MIGKQSTQREFMLMKQCSVVVLSTAKLKYFSLFQTLFLGSKSIFVNLKKRREIPAKQTMTARRQRSIVW
jgi:hypothetical protein